MTTATIDLPHTQWALLNRIAAAPSATAASAVLAEAEASRNDLLAAEDLGYVAAFVDGELVLLDLVKQAPLDGIRLTLTSAGRAWLTGNARNKVLQALVKKSNYSAPLRRVAREADADADVFFALEDAGLVNVRAGGATGPIWRFATEMFRQRGDFIWVQLTAAGRRVCAAA